MPCAVAGEHHTQMSMTTCTGLDDALASVPTLPIASAPPYVRCIHIHPIAQMAADSPYTPLVTRMGCLRGVFDRGRAATERTLDRATWRWCRQSGPRGHPGR